MTNFQILSASSAALATITITLFSRPTPPPDLPLPRITIQQLAVHPNYIARGRFVYDNTTGHTFSQYSIVAILIK